MKAKCEEMGYTFDEMLTLASIIHGEAGTKENNALVSSVIHNRLNDNPNYKLQCDSTTFYLRRNIKEYVSEDEYKKYVEVYSTYDMGGIPEGPINNCSVDDFNAALNPEETDYYYFVTDGEGNFYYSETYDEHLSNCTKAGIY